MLTTVLALALAAAPPVSKAVALAKAESWEELYLAYAAVNGDGYSKADKKTLAGALTKGCAALEGSDAVMAYSMGEKAAELDPLADALLCVGRTGPKAEQSSAAEQALRKGLTQYAKDDRFPVALAQQLLSENDAAGALNVLERVGKKSKEWTTVNVLKGKATAMLSETRTAKAVATSDARAVEKGLPTGPVIKKGGQPPQQLEDPMRGGPPEANGLTSSYESSIDKEGRRIRANQYFRFRYFSGQKDFGQRADYEGRVQAALESARQSSNKLLGKARESPTDVILYSREEFEMHHGPDMARTILGFYSANAIRMNDSAQITPANQATLVHEYVHAVIDEAAGFKAQLVPIWLNEGLAMWVEWRYEGHDGPRPPEAAALRTRAKAGALPTLKSLEGVSLVQTDNPTISYLVSACAIGLLVKKRGADEVLELIKDLGKGKPYAKALEDRFDVTPEHLQKQLDDDLKTR